MTKLSKGQISIELILLMMAVLLAGVLVSYHMTKFTFEGTPLTEVRQTVFGVITVGGVTSTEDEPGFSLNISGLTITPTGSIKNFELYINDTRDDVDYRYNIELGDKGLMLINGTNITQVSVYPTPITGSASEVIFRTSSLDTLLVDLGGGETEFPIPQYINKFIIKSNNPDTYPIYYSVGKDPKTPTSAQLIVDFQCNDVNITLVQAGGGGSVSYTLVEGTDGSISLVEI